jgi:hypothetical protein
MARVVCLQVWQLPKCAGESALDEATLAWIEAPDLVSPPLRPELTHHRQVRVTVEVEVFEQRVEQPVGRTEVAPMAEYLAQPTGVIADDNTVEGNASARWPGEKFQAPAGEARPEVHALYHPGRGGRWSGGARGQENEGESDSK